MQVKNTLIKLVVAAAVMLPYAVSAQTSSINAFSPYTMYGIGEINTPGTTQMRSMGGVRVAMALRAKSICSTLQRTAPSRKRVSSSVSASRDRITTIRRR
mgnify:CR=1 FL=1